MGFFSVLESLGTKSLQTSAAFEQAREAQQRKTVREGILVVALLSPVLLGLAITFRTGDNR